MCIWQLRLRGSGSGCGKRAAGTGRTSSRSGYVYAEAARDARCHARPAMRLRIRIGVPGGREVASLRQSFVRRLECEYWGLTLRY